MTPISISFHFVQIPETALEIPPAVFPPRDVLSGEQTYVSAKTKPPRHGTYLVPVSPLPALGESLAQVGARSTKADGSDELPLREWRERSWGTTSQGDVVRVPLFPYLVPNDAEPLGLVIFGMQFALQAMAYCPSPTKTVEAKIYGNWGPVPEDKKETHRALYLGLSLKQADVVNPYG